MSKSENYTPWKLTMESLYTFDFTYKQLLCFNKASVIMK